MTRKRSGADVESPSRRGLLEMLLGASLAGLVTSVAYPVIRYLVPPEEAGDTGASVMVGRVEEFAPDSGRIFRFGRKPGLLIRTAEGEFRAFGATCTHLDCTVQYRPDFGVIWCACHNGRYDLAGKNISGPPPRPLPEFRVDIRDGEIHVSRVA
ncbi:MAG: cytochrome b6-f complex iron-sulfur subunit [Gemmatimonadota bacterium]|nr:MAG: cytochrome b6-f complex iron-sulfur subunit [Gemmatimonadota bacterium]